jgi:hypothetical protein
MRAGLPISLLLHAGVLLSASVVFSTVEPLKQGRVVPVELITVAEFTDIRASLKAKEPVVAPPASLPMQVKTSTENAPDVADVINIAPDEEMTADPVAPPETIPEESDTSEPEKVADAAPQFDLDRNSTLIDKSKDTSTAADSQIADEGAEDRLVYADAAREAVGSGTQMTLSELDALNSAMYRCWRKPVDATDLEKLIVRLQVDMMPGGFVRDVRVIDRAASRRASPGNPFWDVAEMRAVQAVTKCAPYDFLPQEKFEQWQSLILNFRPKL